MSIDELALDNVRCLRNARGMTRWPLTKDDIERPAYRSLANGIAEAIRAGLLGAGDRLPTHRDLAWKLDISVQTVSRAYEELIRADLVSGEVGRGTFVLRQRQSLDDMPWNVGRARRADLSLMTPVVLPEVQAAWRDSLHRLSDNLPDLAASAFRPEEIRNRYAGLAAEWLARCGIVVEARPVTVTNGVTPAVFSALAVVANPGDLIAVDMYTSHTIGPAAQHLHLGLTPIAGDERGMLPEALVAAVREAQGQITAVYLLPGGAGPQALMMDRERRMALAEAAQALGISIIESDPLGPLPARRPPPIAKYAPERTFYATGLSKVLSPGLRIGFLLTPDPVFEVTVNRHTSMAWMVTPLVAEVAADWMQTGTAETLLTAQRREIAARNRMALRLLPHTSRGILHGLHRWLDLPDGIEEADFVARMADHGIAMTPGAQFAMGERSGAIRICLGAVSRGELERALSKLASLLPLKDPVRGESPESPSSDCHDLI